MSHPSVTIPSKLWRGTLSRHVPSALTFTVSPSLDSPAASTATLHVVNYKPSSDSAEQIGFYWSSNDGTTSNNLDALVVLYNPQNISRGIGSATCSVRDAEYTETETQQDNCQAVIRDFRVSSSS